MLEMGSINHRFERTEHHLKEGILKDDKKKGALCKPFIRRAIE